MTPSGSSISGSSAPASRATSAEADDKSIPPRINAGFPAKADEKSHPPQYQRIKFFDIHDSIIIFSVPIEKLKLPAASRGESSKCKEFSVVIRSLSPQQPAGNTLAVHFQVAKKKRKGFKRLQTARC